RRLRGGEEIGSVGHRRRLGRTNVDRDRGLDRRYLDRSGVRTVLGRVSIGDEREVDRVENGALLDEGENRGKQRVPIRPVTAGGIPVSKLLRRHRQDALRVVVIEQGQTDLFEVVYTLSPARGLSSTLNRRKQKRDQHGNDRDHYQQLDQGECPGRMII